MSEPLRVLALDHARELGGAEVALLTGARGLQGSGYSFTIAAPPGGALEEAVLGSGLDFVALALDRVSPRHPLCARRVLDELRTLLGARRPDVVLLNGVRALKACMALDRDAPPVVAFVHDVLEPGVVSRWMRWSSLFRDRVERFLVPAEAVRPSLVAHGVADASIHVVPPAVDDVPALTADERRAVRRSVGVANDELVIGFVGQLEERKGVDVLLEAVELVALPARVTCVVVGDDPFGEHRRYRDAVVARARRMPQVRITGWRRDAARIIAACDVLVCPSRRDACPLSVLQAMSAGLAVVGTRVGGIPEQLGDSEAGLLIAAGDARELREAIDALLVDRALRERLGGAARERHRTRFAVARARAALGDALAGAVAARTRPREV